MRSMARPLMRRYILNTTLLATYLSLSLLGVVNATQSYSPTELDHNHPRIEVSIPNVPDQVELLEENDVLQGYEADFASHGLTKEIIGRAAADITPLRNNLPITLNLVAGQTVYYVFANSTISGPFSNDSRPALLPDETDFGLLYGQQAERQERRLELRSVSDNNVGLERRQLPGQTRTVYLSANTCLQPTANTSMSTDIPQLELYVSTSNQNPGPGQPNSDRYTFDEGFVNATVQAASNVFVGIHAPNSTTTGGQWNFAVAASIDNWYFASNSSTPGAFLVDTDSQSALLVSSNLTNPQTLLSEPDLRTQWLSASPPFNIFIINGSTPSINGLRRSTCGLANIRLANARINSTIIARNSGNNPKQQFHVEGLSAGTNYYAVLSYTAANQSLASQAPISGGGGHIWQPFSFTTKQDASCRLVYDLPFCDDVAYAVPANASASRNDLVSFYDSGARAYWQNFTNSLQQVACNTTSTAQYSLARNCTHCSRDYKTWLCAVTVPRCVDFSAAIEAESTPNSAFIIPRNLAATQFVNGSDVSLDSVGWNQTIAKKPWYAQSRDPVIDAVVKPGPYGELLPCIDLCYEMVKSCPSSMAFSCPRQRPLLLRSYGIIGDADAVGVALPCNRLGLDQPRRSAAVRLSISLLWPMWLLVLSLIAF